MLIIGVTMVGFPKKARLDPESEDFYKFARYLFTKNERKIFLELPTAEERQRFIQYFWEIRDPNPLTNENEFKDEMEDRFEYVTKYLKEGPVPGWKSDRGRIYILLGPPDNVTEKPFQSNEYDMANIGVIIWYYWNSKIVVWFIDTKGHGLFRMDPNRTSLKLLDELENRKYYIVGKDNPKFEMDVLKFDLAYDSLEKKLLFKVNPQKIHFEKSGSQMMAKFNIELMIYSGENNFSRHSEIKTVYIEQDSLLEKNSKVEFKIPFTLPRGKVKIDTIVTDLLGTAAQRKLFNFKVKREKKGGRK